MCLRFFRGNRWARRTNRQLGAARPWSRGAQAARPGAGLAGLARAPLSSEAAAWVALVADAAGRQLGAVNPDKRFKPSSSPRAPPAQPRSFRKNVN
eukprot:3898915-Pyramimonas_sp.AAC.1